MKTRTGWIILGGAALVAAATFGVLVAVTPPPGPSDEERYWACMETYGVHADDPADAVSADRVAEADAACR